MLELHFETLFQQIAVLLIVAALVGAAGRVLHQPLIISFIAVGIIAGPNVLGIVEVEGTVEVLSQLGIEQVIVNGTLVIADGEHTGALPGRVLRR